jgi:DNA-directed RNA polymerase subunit RPC12/RpoP
MAMQGIRFHTIDLTKIRGKGDFRCPKCQVKISPDDQTENTYTILEPVMKGSCLEKLIIQCNKCGTRIQLLGFNAQAG